MAFHPGWGAIDGLVGWVGAGAERALGLREQGAMLQWSVWVRRAAYNPCAVPRSRLVQCLLQLLKPTRAEFKNGGTPAWVLHGTWAPDSTPLPLPHIQGGHVFSCGATSHSLCPCPARQGGGAAAQGAAAAAACGTGAAAAAAGAASAAPAQQPGSQDEAGVIAGTRRRATSQRWSQAAAALRPSSARHCQPMTRTAASSLALAL